MGAFRRYNTQTAQWEILSGGPVGYTGSAGVSGYTGSAGSSGSGYDTPATSTGYFAVPVGTTAQRPASPAVGMIRYNTTIGGFELYGASGWISFGVVEITAVTPATFNGESGTQFSITGSGFINGSAVKFVTNDNTEYTAGSVTVVSSTNILATTPQDFTVAQEPLSVKVIIPGGANAVLAAAIDCGGVPAWTTAAGSLGTFYDSGTTVSINLVATDPDANATISYSLVSGSLPANITLAANGQISGTTQTVTSNTTYNFTVAASDNANNQTTRSFSMTVSATNYFGNGADGAGVF